jgi:hypothetical protein
VSGWFSSKTDTSGKARLWGQTRAEAYTGRKGLRDCVGVKREPFGSQEDCLQRCQRDRRRYCTTLDNHGNSLPSG